MGFLIINHPKKLGYPHDELGTPGLLAMSESDHGVMPSEVRWEERANRSVHIADLGPWAWKLWRFRRCLEVFESSTNSCEMGFDVCLLSCEFFT